MTFFTPPTPPRPWRNPYAVHTPQSRTIGRACKYGKSIRLRTFAYGEPASTASVTSALRQTTPEVASVGHFGVRGERRSRGALLSYSKGNRSLPPYEGGVGGVERAPGPTAYVLNPPCPPFVRGGVNGYLESRLWYAKASHPTIEQKKGPGRPARQADRPRDHRPVRLPQVAG